MYAESRVFSVQGRDGVENVGHRRDDDGGARGGSEIRGRASKYLRATDDYFSFSFYFSFFFFARRFSPLLLDLSIYESSSQSSSTSSSYAYGSLFRVIHATRPHCSPADRRLTRVVLPPAAYGSSVAMARTATVRVLHTPTLCARFSPVLLRFPVRGSLAVHRRQWRRHNH